jgi:hypothetical protein
MSLKDGMSKREEWFSPRQPKETIETLTDKLNVKSGKKDTVMDAVAKELTNNEV